MNNDNYLRILQARNVSDFNRAKIAQKYLNFRGIKDNQIKNGPFGERRPIAMNALKGGADTPEGRQLNRRIELVIYDENGKELNLVKPIIVPSNLKIKNTN